LYIAGKNVKCFICCGKVWQLVKKLNIELTYVLNISNHQGNANQNHNEVSPHTVRMTVIRQEVRNAGEDVVVGI